MSDKRKFPPPWTVDELAECFTVTAANGIECGRWYFEDEETRRTLMKRLTRAEAFAMASNFAKLPALLQAEKYRKAKGE